MRTYKGGKNHVFLLAKRQLLRRTAQLPTNLYPTYRSRRYPSNSKFILAVPLFSPPCFISKPEMLCEVLDSVCSLRSFRHLQNFIVLRFRIRLKPTQTCIDVFLKSADRIITHKNMRVATSLLLGASHCDQNTG